MRLKFDKIELYGSRIFPIILLLICFSLSFLYGCGKEDASPENQVRLFVAEGEIAAEKRELKTIKKLISDSYTDDHNREKIDLVRIVAAYFLRHKNIHLLSHIGSLHFPDEGRAELTLFVAMSGQPVTDVKALFDIRADLHRFDMVLGLENSKWRLKKAAWRQAKIEDFVSLPKE